MKICQLCAVDFTLAHFLRPLMRGMRDAGHEVVGVCSDGALLDEVRADGFRVETVTIERNYNLRSHARSAAALIKLFRAEKFDIVHVHTPVASLVGRYAAWRAGVPRIVYTAHGFYFHEHMAWPKRAVFVALEWLAGRVTDTLFTQAEEDAETARRLGLCRTGHVLGIGNGVDPARFGPDANVRAKVRKTLGAPDDKVIILMVGRMVAEKGYAELFRAMRKVDAELWVVGERLASDHAAGVDAVIAGIGADPDWAAKVRFLGYRGDVPDVMRAADIFTLPSHREGMPRSIIEAMFTALPVVATDIRGTREEVIEGETGLMVPVRDEAALAGALQMLAKDADLRARMGAAGRVRALAEYDEALAIGRQIEHLDLDRDPEPEGA